MSKLDKFLKIGHYVTVQEHLLKMRNPENIAKALEHRNVNVRLGAIYAFHRIGKPGTPYIVQALSNQNPYVRIAATHVMKEIGPNAAPYARIIVEQSLKHKTPSVRTSAARALAEIGDTSVLPELEKALEKEKSLIAHWEMEEAVETLQKAKRWRFLRKIKTLFRK
ncbi:MAG TPA: HEAT repeat domain-containing protein [Candidatus Norongarragalinales archaeon]|jgi:HEAT repeat protein|nr:HEAT repeat domain-containing protein [Candidatus Norongarragalinales archaeon]